MFYCFCSFFLLFFVLFVSNTHSQATLLVCYRLILSVLFPLINKLILLLLLLLLYINLIYPQGIAYNPRPKGGEVVCRTFQLRWTKFYLKISIWCIWRNDRRGRRSYMPSNHSLILKRAIALLKFWLDVFREMVA